VKRHAAAAILPGALVRRSGRHAPRTANAPAADHPKQA